MAPPDHIVLRAALQVQAAAAQPCEGATAEMHIADRVADDARRALPVLLASHPVSAAVPAMTAQSLQNAGKKAVLFGNDTKIVRAFRPPSAAATEFQEIHQFRSFFEPGNWLARQCGRRGSVPANWNRRR